MKIQIWHMIETKKLGNFCFLCRIYNNSSLKAKHVHLFDFFWCIKILQALNFKLQMVYLCQAKWNMIFTTIESRLAIFPLHCIVCWYIVTFRNFVFVKTWIFSRIFLARMGGGWKRILIKLKLKTGLKERAAI